MYEYFLFLDGRVESRLAVWIESATVCGSLNTFELIIPFTPPRDDRRAVSCRAVWIDYYMSVLIVASDVCYFLCGVVCSGLATVMLLAAVAG